ncbi:MAG: hypothetical protein ETSY1_23610 [Candidatus Entotheonella factor]|uniref:Uncharacterized protein n=1 Tax=Entotheonella factor TaxID=1429438 RepID=W4LGR8_ENTF1|nr:MAG: hypothetical protein ETSY1_23610 [Candidatus Entotheonella factor]
MHAHKVQVTIRADHQVTIVLPEDFPAGPAEVIVLAEALPTKRVVKLAGVLAPEQEPLAPEAPIADALEELRRERAARWNT